jgi:hypothetical protein
MGRIELRRISSILLSAIVRQVLVLSPMVLAPMQTTKVVRMHICNQELAHVDLLIDCELISAKPGELPIKARAIALSKWTRQRVRQRVQTAVQDPFQACQPE